MTEPLAKSRLVLRIGVAIAIVAALGVAALYTFRATATVAEVKRGIAADVVTGTVTVHADKDIQELKSEMPGRVVWVDARAADKPVNAGEPIVKLDTADLDPQIEQAEFELKTFVERRAIQLKSDPRLAIANEQLAEAKRRHDRKELSDDDLKAMQRGLAKVVSDLAIEEADAQQVKTRLEYQVSELKRRRDKMTVVAPMDGMLRSVIVAEGALIGSGTTVATFFSNQRVVKVQVSEEDVSRIRVGQPAKVRLLALGNEDLDAKVSEILRHADESTQRYTVHLDVKADPSKLMPFSKGEATITVAEHPNQPLVPRRALFNDNQVYVVKNGVIEKRQISTGFKALNFAEVTGNLAERELVIVDDLDQFRDGQRVKVELQKE